MYQTAFFQWNIDWNCVEASFPKHVSPSDCAPWLKRGGTLRRPRCQATETSTTRSPASSSISCWTEPFSLGGLERSTSQESGLHTNSGVKAEHRSWTRQMSQILARVGEVPMTHKNIHLCSNLCCRDLMRVTPFHPCTVDPPKDTTKMTKESIFSRTPPPYFPSSSTLESTWTRLLQTVPSAGPRAEQPETQEEVWRATSTSTRGVACAPQAKRSPNVGVAKSLRGTINGKRLNKRPEHPCRSQQCDPRLGPEHNVVTSR